MIKQEKLEDDALGPEPVDVKTGLTVVPHSTKARTFDIAILVILGLTLGGVVSYWINRGFVEEAQEEGSLYLIAAVVLGSLLGGLITSHLVYMGQNWIVIVFFALVFGFLFYALVMALYTGLLPDYLNGGFFSDTFRNKTDEETDELNGQGGTPVKCRDRTIRALFDSPEFSGLLDALDAGKLDEAKKLNRRIARTFHPDVCISIGCADTCAQTFTRYQQTLEKLGYSR